LPFHKIATNQHITDNEFDEIFQNEIKSTSEIHFTPVEVCIVAARYLAEVAGTRVLDIGSGAGKFCFVGASCTDGFFVGVELRRSFSEAASQIYTKNHLSNVQFIHANITDIDFSDYDAFYIFNAFHENITISERINDDIPLNRDFYYKYSMYVKEQLDSKPSGTRLVTYFSFGKEIPDSYEIKFSAFNGKLKFWEKGK